MKVRICPLCDHEMKKRHHCDTCNSFIWKAEMLDIHFNTEARGMGEEDCSYGAAHDAIHHHASEDGNIAEETAVFTAAKKNNKASWRDVSKTAEARQRAEKSEETNQKSRRINIAIWAVFLGIILIAIIAQNFDSIEDTWHEMTDNSGQEELASEVPSDAFEMVDAELSESDIAGLTQACDYIHLPLSEDAALQLTESFVMKMGWDYAQEKSFYGYARRSEYADMEIYEYKYGFYDENAEQYIEICTDAVTGELHSVYTSFYNVDDARDYMQFLLKEGFGVTQLTEDDYAGMYDLYEDDYAYFYFGHCEIGVFYSEYTESWETHIYGVQSPYDYEQSPADIKEISVDEAKIAGEACSGAAHISGLAGSEAESDIDAWIQENWQAEAVKNTQDLCQAETFVQLGSLTYDKTTFSHLVRWYHDNTPVNIFLDSDIVSGEVHQLDISDISEAMLGQYFALSTQVLHLEVDSDLLAQACLDRCRTEGYAFVNAGDLEFYMDYSDSSDTYYLSVRPVQ